MKKILLFSLIINSFHAKAQTWVLPSSKWIYANHAQGSGVINHIDTFSVLYDSVVLGKNAFRLSTGEFTYEQNDTVYYLAAGVWVPTLFFNLPAHDTVTFHANVPCLVTDSSYKYAFDSAGSVSLPGGIALRSMYFSLGTARDNGFTGGTERNHYTERLSAIYDRLSFSCFSQVETYSLCNYGDSTIPGFWMVPAQSCVVAGIEEVNSGAFSIFPNPVNSLLQLVFSNPADKKETISITNMLGETLIRKSDADNSSIDVSALAAGIYFVQTGNMRKQFVVDR